jgi:MFS transporter, DHA2 family, methylenomycin A resistance protein
MNSPRTPEPGPASYAWIVVATSVAFFMIVLDTSIVNLALARIQDALGASLGSLQWLVDGYALVFASLLLTAGSLGDRFQPKRVFALGLGVFTAASVACATASTLTALQIARIVQGVGAAMLLPNSLAALNQTIVDPNRRAPAVAAWAGAGAVGIAVGPMLGGFLVSTLGWRSIFWVNVPVGVAALVIGSRVLKAAPVGQVRSVDLPGQALAIVALASMTYALMNLGHDSGAAAVASAVTAGAGIAFLIVEKRSQEPMLPLPLLGADGPGPVVLVGLLHNVAVYGLIFVLGLVLQQLRHLDPVHAGLMFAPMTISLALGTRLGGRSLRRHSPFIPFVGGHALAAMGATALSFLGFSGSSAVLCVPLACLGLGAGLTTPAMSLLALDAVPRDRSGLASGILNSARQTGGVIGVALLGAVLGDPATSSGARHSAQLASVALACACLVALTAGLRRRKRALPHPVPAAPAVSLSPSQGDHP